MRSRNVVITTRPNMADVASCNGDPSTPRERRYATGTRGDASFACYSAEDVMDGYARFRCSFTWIGVAVLVAMVTVRPRAEDWPEWRGKGRLGLWNETGIVQKFPEGGPPLKWRATVGQGYAGPAVAAGRVFVTDARRVKANQVIERALALDENTGETRWTREWQTDYSGLQLVYAIGPRATPTIDDERVYVLGAMGNLLALDVKTGAVLWQRDFVKDFNASIPAWGMTGAPLVDGDRLICLVGGEPDAKVVALDKWTGAEVWRALSSDWEPGYGQPITIEAAGVHQLIIYQPKAITALDPATGKTYWEVPYSVDLGMTIPTPVRDGPFLFVTSQWGGGRMLKLDDAKPGATLLWSGGMESAISTPVIQDGYVYGLDEYGEILCLEEATGKEIWKVKDLLKERAHTGTAFFVRQGDRYFINNDRGELVIAKLSPQGYQEIDRARLIEPTHPYVRRRELPNVLWSHAAYANKHIIIRNDKEIARFSLAAGS